MKRQWALIFLPTSQPLKPHAKEPVVNHVALFGIVEQELFVLQRLQCHFDATGSRELLAEVEAGERYWMTEEETRALQRANAPYQSTLDLERIILDCFRQPAEDEPSKPISMTAILDIVMHDYPTVRPLHSTKIQLGHALLNNGFLSKREGPGMLYYVIPRQRK